MYPLNDFVNLRNNRCNAISKVLASLLFLIAVVLLLLLSSLIPNNATSSVTTFQTTSSTQTSTTSKTPWYCGSTNLNSIQQVNASVDPYDDQVSFNFGGNYTSLAFNVTAVQYTDNYGYGPGYFLNGLSNKHYWYQVGVSWNWGSGGGPNSGFQFMYEEWNSSNLPVPTYRGADQIRTTPGGIRAGDNILLEINFTNNLIETLAKDWDTNSSTLVIYPNLNATTFVPYYGMNRTYFSTSVLAEWYHVDAIQCYRPYNSFLSQTSEIPNSTICIDEWNFTGLPQREWSTNNATTVFSRCSGYTVEPSGEFRDFAFAVANASSDENEFRTS